MTDESKVVQLGSGKPLTERPEPSAADRADHDAAPREDLIELLEELTAMAKSGRLRSLVGTGFVEDGCRVSLFGGDIGSGVWAMKGALCELANEYSERAIHRMVAEPIED